MCVILYKAKRRFVSDEIIRTCWKNNPHGAGAMWFGNGKVETFKVHMDEGVEKFIEMYHAIKPEKKRVALHFRIATHGDKSLSNCHPHRVNDDMWLVHNGIISNIPTKGAESDTAAFARLLGGLPEGWEKNRDQTMLIDMSIGWSKIVLFKAPSTVLFWGEGVMDKGIWYSNDTYKEREVVTYGCGTSSLPFHYKKEFDKKEKRYVTYKSPETGFCECGKKLSDADIYLCQDCKSEFRKEQLAYLYGGDA
jgi:hypothetical protein